MDPMALTARWSCTKRPSSATDRSALSFGTRPQGEEATPRRCLSWADVHKRMRP